MANKRRNITYRYSDTPLTSKRVRIILSNPKDSASLARAIRARRHNNPQPFKVTSSTEALIAND